MGLTSFACRRRIEDTSRYRSPHVLANSSRCLHLALTVSFVGSPYHGIVRDGSSQGVSVPCMSSWEYRCPHVLAGGVGPLHVLARLRVPCIVRQRYRALDLLARLTSFACRRHIFDMSGLRPLHDYSRSRVWCGCGFDLRVAGCYPTPPDYIVCTSMVDIVCVVWVSLSRCGLCAGVGVW